MAADHLHIFLVRHYRPKVNRRGWYNQTRAAQFLQEYDAAEIEALTIKPEGLPYGDIKRVHCSSLPRAKTTAMALFGPNVILMEDRIFNECERKILSLPLLRFPIKIWLAGARALWLLGLNSYGIETYQQAQLRAQAAAEKLSQYATEEKTTVLVAHGMLNIFIKKYLKKAGWQVIRQDGNGYLGVSELVKTVS